MIDACLGQKRCVDSGCHIHIHAGERQSLSKRPGTPESDSIVVVSLARTRPWVERRDVGLGEAQTLRVQEMDDIDECTVQLDKTIELSRVAIHQA